MTLDEIHRQAISDALQASGGNVSRAARALGIGRTTLIGMVGRCGLRREDPTIGQRRGRPSVAGARPSADPLPDARFYVRLKRHTAWQQTRTAGGVLVSVEPLDHWFTVGLIPIELLNAQELGRWLRRGEAQLVMVQEREESTLSQAS